eukprot:scaffold4307_cov67-Phaeocystis_antarctica.AAC.2
MPPSAPTKAETPSTRSVYARSPDAVRDTGPSAHTAAMPAISGRTRRAIAPSTATLPETPWKPPAGRNQPRAGGRLLLTAGTISKRACDSMLAPIFNDIIPHSFNAKAFVSSAAARASAGRIRWRRNMQSRPRLGMSRAAPAGGGGGDRNQTVLQPAHVAGSLHKRPKSRLTKRSWTVWISQSDMMWLYASSVRVAAVVGVEAAAVVEVAPERRRERRGSALDIAPCWRPLQTPSSEK